MWIGSGEHGECLFGSLLSDEALGLGLVDHEPMDEFERVIAYLWVAGRGI